MSQHTLQNSEARDRINHWLNNVYQTELGFKDFLEKLGGTLEDLRIADESENPFENYKTTLLLGQYKIILIPARIPEYGRIIVEGKQFTHYYAMVEGGFGYILESIKTVEAGNEITYFVDQKNKAWKIRINVKANEDDGKSYYVDYAVDGSFSDSRRNVKFSPSNGWDLHLDPVKPIDNLELLISQVKEIYQFIQRSQVEYQRLLDDFDINKYSF